MPEVGSAVGGGCGKVFPAARLFRRSGLVAGALLAWGCGTPAQAAPGPQEGAAGTRLERAPALDLGSLSLPGDGGPVLTIDEDGAVVDCRGQLHGAAEGVEPDAFEGVGILVTGKNVTLRGARVSGFKVGIHAVGADGLVLEDCDVSGNFRQRLRSTPEKEAVEDWLSPHANDDHEWVRNYGAGIHVERSERVTVRGCRAREGQNGLILDRVNHSEVSGNDFSFLSGWGIAMWRSSDNRVLRNTCDFCIRGYSHGVYNRGQDSAGILMFEQCSRNVIAENSATHCGDGIFVFAGQEALGAHPPPAEDFDYTRRGCDENQFLRNDLSHAAAHGLELTFSFGNYVHRNHLEGNAICGIWGGYSRSTGIAHNTFVANGDAGYGLERGGVNIEHGQSNDIIANVFRDNACGIHLWWDEDAHLADLPWTRANGHETSGNTIQYNRFEGDRTAIHLRAAPDTRVTPTVFVDVGKEIDGEFVEWQPMICPTPQEPEAYTEAQLNETFGEPRRGAWTERGGRELIRMGEWGPLEPE